MPSDKYYAFRYGHSLKCHGFLAPIVRPHVLAFSKVLSIETALSTLAGSRCSGAVKTRLCMLCWTTKLRVFLNTLVSVIYCTLVSLRACISESNMHASVIGQNQHKAHPFLPCPTWAESNLFRAVSHSWLWVRATWTMDWAPTYCCTTA